MIGSELTFVGGTVSNTIDAAYTVIAFIKVFNSDFSVVKLESTVLVAGENFEVNYTNVEGADTFLQYGFQVVGVNANPDDEAALGSVVVSAPLAVGINDNNLSKFVVYPNPSNDNWYVSSTNQEISTIELFDIMGKKIASFQPNSTNYSINNENLSKGVYFAKVYSDGGVNSLKLIKK